MTNVKLGLAALSGLFISACSQAPDKYYQLQPSQSYSYQCEGGQAFSVRYYTGLETATLTMGSRQYSLVQVASGSGSRYILGDKAAQERNPLILHTKGNMARLSVGETIYKYCTTR
ncbi:MliC family protein [Vibrio sp.]|uniref:MliC family protein n=1 Tax=Vibrio sp. TaxID=678 RepID=UPI003D103736